MIKSKRTDALCALVIVLTLLLTLVFMNGKALGLKAYADDAESDFASAFTDRDLDSSWNEDEATFITLSDEGITLSSTSGAYAQGSTVVIVCEGTYLLRGSLSDGQVVVNSSSSEKIQLVLDGADIHCADSAPLYVTQAGKVFLTLAEGTENTLSCGETFSQETQAAGVTGAVFSEDDLTVNGSGSLTVNAPGQHGIVSQDDLVITGGELTVTAATDGLRGRDSVRICSGSLTIDAGEDGIQSNNDEAGDKGYVLITGGDFLITSGNDGIQAETTLTVEDGSFTITSGGGAQEGVTTGGSQEGGFGGGIGPGSFSGQPGETDEQPTEDSSTQQTDALSGATPSGGTGTEQTLTEAPQGQPERSADSGSDPQGPGSDGGRGPMSPDTTTRYQQGGTAQDSTQTAEDTASDSAKGLKAGVLLSVSGGTFDLSSYDDALHSNGDITVTGGALTLASSDDGVHADGSLTVSGGRLTITQCYEGLEACHILIEGGALDITSDDDGLNASNGTESGFGGMGGGPGGTIEAEDSTDADSADTPDIRITGGTVHIRITNDADGIDSNGWVYVEGGVITVSGSSGNGNGGLDYGDGQYTATIGGGSVVIAGGSGMAETFDESSGQCSILYNFTDEAPAGTQVTLTDASGRELLSFSPENAFTSVVVSCPDLTQGEIYTLTVGDASIDVEISSVSVTIGTSSGMFAGSPGGQPSDGGPRGGARTEFSGAAAPAS